MPEDDKRLKFVALMSLEALNSQGQGGTSESHFMSKHTAASLAGGAGYGGHVFAQSVWAASNTVPEGMVVHNVHGYFTLPVHTDRPLFYKVQTLSSGRSYCTRFVTVKQPLEPCSFPFQSGTAGQNLGNVCFASMCSFKKDSESSTKHQIQADLRKKYGSVFKEDPGEHGIAPKVDAPWWRQFAEQNPGFFKNDFPGLDIRKVDMSEYNKTKLPEDWRQLSYYRPIGTIPVNLPNLHACAHLFASDRNSLFLISNAVGFGDEVGAMGSLSHSVVFHVNSEELIMRDEWWCQEAWTSRSEGGRGMHESRIWNSREVHIGSTWQDGLVRKAEDGKSQKQRAMFLQAMLRKAEVGGKTLEGFGKHKL